MKKLIIILLFTLTLTLSSCNLNQLDYTDFNDRLVSSYGSSETVSPNRHILYYYDSSDEASGEVKQEILDFFHEFVHLEFYLLDTSTIVTEVSKYGAYIDEPIVYVISSGQVYEEYIGLDEIKDFIIEYNSIEFDYDLFEAQHVTSYEEILSIENDSYILYYYLDSCPHCINTKPHFLPWAFTKNVEDIYFMEGSTVPNADNKPTELIILNSGTPILVLLSNGKFANEFYSGTEEVIGYITEVGEKDIIAEELDLHYEDFEANKIDYTDTLSITNELHFEYYYSPYCSHCTAIRPQVLKFFNDLEAIEYYLIDTSVADGLPKIESFRYTPSLYVIYNGEVIDEYVGGVDIPAFIVDYLNGTIDYSEYE